MIDIAVPGRGILKIAHLVLDINGTIAQDGKLIPGVADRLDLLSQHIDIYIVTADTRGNAQELTRPLNTELHRVQKGAEDTQKRDLVWTLGKNTTVSIGNGANDILMLKDSLVGICVIGNEGASPKAMLVSDVVVTHVNDALDLLLTPTRLIATLRK
jgi:soluble P-type ATPase